MIVKWATGRFWPIAHCSEETSSLDRTFSLWGRWPRPRVGGGAMVRAWLKYPQACLPSHCFGRNRACGLALIGLKGVTRDERAELKRCYREILMKNGNPTERAKGIIDGSSPPKSSLGRSFVDFFLEGDRGFATSQSAR